MAVTWKNSSATRRSPDTALLLTHVLRSSAFSYTSVAHAESHGPRSRWRIYMHLVFVFTDNLGGINGETSMHFEWLSSIEKPRENYINPFRDLSLSLDFWWYLPLWKCSDIYHRKLLYLCFMCYTYFEISSTL